MDAETLRPPRVVVVDDTPDIRLLLKLSLEASGITVVGEAGDGLAGISAAQQYQPDLVLLDLAMPVMDGLEALPKIKRAAPHCRILVLSGFASDAMSNRALSAGADGFLQKGISTAEIVRVVRETIGSLTLEVAAGDSTDDRADDRADNRADEPSASEGSRETTRPASPEEVETGGSTVDAAARVAEDAAVGLLLLGRTDAGAFVVRYANPAAVEILGIAAPEPGSLLIEHAPSLARLMEKVVHAGTTETRERVVAPVGSLDVQVRVSDVGATLSFVPQDHSEETKRLRNAISATAHEFRNPVTVLAGVADAFRTRGALLGPDQQAALLSAVGRQAAVLERLTEDLLLSARTLRGSLALNVVAVEVAAILAHAAADLHHGLDLRIRGAEGVSVLSDPTRLTQMVTNLLSNATKYGAPPFEVEVKREPGQVPSVRISVLDRGPGVPEGFRSRLFDEFTRAEGVGARGNGLGLSLVRSLAQAQGGWADYEPREGGGSVFSIVLPEATQAAADSRAPAPPRHRWYGRRGGQAGRPDSV